MKVLFVYPRFDRHSECHPELRQWVPMNEYLGSPSLGLAAMAAVTPPEIEIEYRDDRLTSAQRPTDADVVAFSFFTPAATRALELADWFRAQGKTVVAGGIFPTAMPEICLLHFDAVVVGEGERAWPKLLEDLRRGMIQRIYREEVRQPLETLPQPRYEMYFSVEGEGFRPDDYPVQLSRGCPLSCQACILPVSMGPSMREVPLERVLAQLKYLAAHGKRACLTEDTSWFPGASAKHMKELFSAMIEQKLEAMISYIGISMPQLLTAPEELLLLAKRAGVTMFYLVGGFDPITMRAFTGHDQKALDRAYKAIARAHQFGIEPYTSFLIGNDADDEGTVQRMLDFARVSGIKKAEFAIFTPYPGTPAWKRLEAEGRILDRTWARYNDANVVFQPKQMSPSALEQAYLELWRGFYSGPNRFTQWSVAERTIQF